MSLINQMLKDLEQRNAPTENAKPLAGEVRAVSMSKPSALPMWLLILLLVVGAGGIAAWKVWLAPKPKAATAVVPAPVKHPLPPLAQTKKEVPVAAAPPVPVQAAAPMPMAQPITEAPPAAIPEPAPSRLPGLERTLSSSPVEEDKRRDATSTEQKVKRKSAPLPDSTDSQPVKAGHGTGVVAETVAEKQKQEKLTGKSVRGSSSTPLKTMSAAQSAENFYRQAVALLQQGRVVEAKAALHQALGENPVNLDARQLLVGLLTEENHQSEAENLLKEGLRLSPEQTGFSMELARLQVEAGGRKEALATLQEGLQHAGDDAEYHAFLAALLQREERHEEAVTHYLTALKSDPAKPSWLVGIGISLQALGKLADAGDAYSRAQQSQSLSPDLAQFVDQRLKQIKQQLR